jgi:phosphoglycolate phosphatase-like HAD superfamily hydrolase
MLRLITDFDGPIMDVSERYYRVYLYCLDQLKTPHQQVKTLAKSEFWRLKRSRVPEKDIGLRSGLEPEQAEKFAQLRRATVHTLPYLPYDQPWPGALATLERLQALDVELIVMTMRRVCELDEALQRVNLSVFFPLASRYCLSNDYVKTTDIEDKPRLMARAMAELPPVDSVWMVGDTEADIVAAHSQQIPVVAVLSGIRDREQLSQFKPRHIVANLGEAVDWILAQEQEQG